VLKTLVCEIYRLQIMYLAETYTGAVPLTEWCDSFGQNQNVPYQTFSMMWMLFYLLRFLCYYVDTCTFVPV